MFRNGFLNPAEPYSISGEIRCFFSGGVEHYPHHITEHLTGHWVGKHGVRTMFACCFTQYHTMKFRCLSKNTYIQKALGLKQSRVIFILHEERNILWQCLLCRIIPMVKVSMGQDNSIHAFQNFLYRHRKRGQRIAKLAAIGISEAWICSRLRKHRVNEKCRISIGDFDCCIADKLHGHRCFRLLFHRKRGVHKNG